MIKLVAELQENYGYFRFYRNDYTSKSKAFFDMIECNTAENVNGNQYFLPTRILKYLKDLEIPCQIEVLSKHNGRLMEVLLDLGIINDCDYPNELSTVKF